MKIIISLKDSMTTRVLDNVECVWFDNGALHVVRIDGEFKAYRVYPGEHVLYMEHMIDTKPKLRAEDL